MAQKMNRPTSTKLLPPPPHIDIPQSSTSRNNMHTIWPLPTSAQLLCSPFSRYLKVYMGGPPPPPLRRKVLRRRKRKRFKTWTPRGPPGRPAGRGLTRGRTRCPAASGRTADANTKELGEIMATYTAGMVWCGVCGRTCRLMTTMSVKPKNAGPMGSSHRSVSRVRIFSERHWYVLQCNAM